MSEPRACWYKEWSGEDSGKWKPGTLLQWGSESDDGGQYTVGIVEDQKTQRVRTPTPESICFASIPPGETA